MQTENHYAGQNHVDADPEASRMPPNAQSLFFVKNTCVEQGIKHWRLILPLRIFMLIMIVLCSSTVTYAAQSQYQATGVDASLPEVSLVPRLKVIEDTDNSLTESNILKIFAAKEVYGQQVASFGFTTSTYWFLTPIYNHGTLPLNRLIVFEHTWLDDIQVTLIAPDGTAQHYHGGDLLGFGQRTLLHQKINFELTLPPGNSQLLLRIRTDDPFLVGITLWERSAFFESDSNARLHTGLIYGALLALLFYNLFLFFSVKETVYAAYVGYVFAFLVIHSTYNGFLFPLLWPESPIWENWAHSIFLHLYIASGLFFAIQFLELKRKLYRAYLWAMTMSFVFVASFVLTAAVGGYALNVIASMLWVFIYAPFVLFLGIYSFKAGNRAARFFFLAAIAGVIGLFITALSVIGWIPYSTLSYHAVDYGMLIDAILLSLALADRLRLARAEVELSRDQMLALSRSQAARLEKAVAQRTLELEDINESNVKLVHELGIKKHEAEESNADKTRFLVSASHDLRQPLHALDLYLGVLAREKNAKKHDEWLGKARQSSVVLGDLLNGLLDISQLDAGSVKVEKRMVSLAPLLEECAVEFAQQATEKDIDLRLRIQHGACATTDPMLFGRMLRNLLSNAIRYTESGKVLLAVRRRSDHLRVEVWDTGSGIAEEKREAIFSEFYQLGNPERDREKGLGLGLAIVRRLSGLLDHPIHLRSQPGRGSCFCISLPACAVGNTCVQTKSDELQRDIAGMFVLLIDDNEAILDAMRNWLRAQDCEVLATSSGRAMIEELGRLEYARPDVIVADYRLRGEENGVSVVGDLREYFASDIPAIIISGDTSKNVTAMVKEAHCQFLAKPVEEAQLLFALAQFAPDETGSDYS